jgi:hypothetical protein
MATTTTKTAKLKRAPATTAATAPAGAVVGVIDSVLPSSRDVAVKHGPRNRTKSTARVAVPAPYAPRAGDTVVLVRGDDTAADAPGYYVVGVLAALREVRPVAATSDGTEVSVEGEPGAEVVRVADGRGRALFEYHTHGGRSVVYAPAGDLEIRADHGAIELAARDAVRLRADTGSVEVTAREGRVAISQVTTVVDVARHVVGSLETRATQLVERAKNAYREVEELSQHRAGRMRLVADATLHLLGQRALFKARGDVKIKGEEIALG